MAEDGPKLRMVSAKPASGIKRYWERYPLVLKKLQQVEAWYGLDQLPDELLFKIAAHALGCMPDDRYAAICAILNHKLPIPVPKQERSAAGDSGAAEDGHGHKAHD